MLTLLRRYLSLCALLFWQGGLTFYAGVVIPIGLQVLPLHMQAQITRRATNWLNAAGVVVLALLLWDLASFVDTSRIRFRGRVVSWIVLFATLTALFGLHYWMDLLNPPEGNGPTNPGAFGLAHALYLAASTVQWLAALIYLGTAVSAWRAEDTQRGVGKGVGEEMEWEKERKG